MNRPAGLRSCSVLLPVMLGCHLPERGQGRSLQGDNNHVLKVHWQERVRDVGDWCESQTPLLMEEEDVAFQDCLENDKKFHFQYRDG